MVVSAVRALKGEPDDTFMLVQRVADLGEPLYSKLEPTGYPNNGDGWLSASSVLGRMNFSAALVSGSIPGVKPDVSTFANKDAVAIGHELLGRDATQQTMAAITQGFEGKDAAPTVVVSLLLGSPDFQRR
jgi:uncharacterized protein (DUF1800 family)